MINVPLNPKIALEKNTFPCYARVYGFGADTFYFRCNEGHLGKYDLDVSGFKGFEGTVKQKLTCYRRGCHFSDNIFLQNWLFQP